MGIIKRPGETRRPDVDRGGGEAVIRGDKVETWATIIDKGELDSKECE